MGKCIVCNKSAGPFYSLHKVCLPVYRDAQKCLKTKLSTYLNSEKEAPISSFLSCRPSEAFSKDYFKQICINAWEEHAKRIVSLAELDAVSAKKLLHIASELEFSSNEIERYLLLRLKNIEYLEVLQNDQQVIFDGELDLQNIELNKGEYVIWKFDEIDKSEPQQFSQQKTWTVFNSLLDNLFMKSRYKELDIKIERSGELYVTNQGLHYLYGDLAKETKFSEVHSITPMKNGIRVQATLRNATPDTYITGDGRFAYALLLYAQGKND